MANLKADSPLCRRIALSFLDFLNSVEPTSPSDVESLEVARDCLSEVFKIDSSTASNPQVPKSDSLIEIFNSKTGKNEIKSDQSHEEPRADTSHTSCTNNTVDTKIPGTSQSLSDTNNANTRTIGVHDDEIFSQFFSALEKVQYFGSTSNGDDEQALERATHLFHNALMEMKKSGSEDFDLKKLADTFKLQGNKAMQSKLYSDAIELYTIAIGLCDDNAVYYCNRAAAYTQTNQQTEAINDCHKAIAIDPTYSKAYSRLGFTYYAQGNYRDAIDKGFKKALQLDPNNESVRGNIQAAEQKLREQQQRASRDQNSSSTSHSNGDNSGGGFARGNAFPSIPFNLNGRPFDMGNMFRNMAQGGMGMPMPMPMPGTNSNPGSTDEPGIRVGVNVGGGDQVQMPEEIYGTIRSVIEMFSDGTTSTSSSTSHVNHPQDNPNGN